MTRLVWPEEDEKLLRELWELNISNRRLAKEHFGGKYSRNAITGKASRMGLAKRMSSVPANHTQAMHAAAIRIKQKQQRARRQQKKQPPTTHFATEMALEEVPATAVTLFEANKDHCRWPFGDPKSENFRFCGAKPEPLGFFSYCAHHTAMATRSHPGRPFKITRR